MKEQYLGDGLYVNFDGNGLTLWTERWDFGKPQRHWVYLEPEIYAALLRYVDSIKTKKEP